MARFYSSFVNKVDKKGRVSVPSAFRRAVADEGFEGVYCYASLKKRCIEGGGQGYMDMLADAMEAFDPLDDAQDQLARAMIGGSTPLSFDGEGRVLLPADLMEFAGITEGCTFIGVGDHFEIWEPEAGKAEMEASRAFAAENRALLKRPVRAVAPAPKGEDA